MQSPSEAMQAWLSALGGDVIPKLWLWGCAGVQGLNSSCAAKQLIGKAASDYVEKQFIKISNTVEKNMTFIEVAL